MTTKRWTLAVVCVATAMLMLDIAVVNTALSRIADDLGTGLSGLQWVVDAYTLALASVVLTAGSLADRFGRRRLFTGGLALFTARLRRLRGLASIEALVAARAAQGLGAAVMFAVSLAILAHAFPERQGARGRPGRLRRRHRRVVRRRPARRRRADQRPRLAVDLPHQPAPGRMVPVDHPHEGRRVARPARRARSTSPARSRSPPPCSCSCSASCGPTRTAGAAPRSSPPSPSPSRCWPRSWRSSAASRSRCSRSGCSATGTSPARRSPPSRSRARSSPCSSTRRSTSSRCSGCRPSRRASSTCPARS